MSAERIANVEQLISQVAAANSYGILWNGDEPWDKMFTSQLVTFPARDKISAGKGVLDRPVYDADGDPIPGSLLLEDIKGAEGGDREGMIVFDAKKAIIKWFGLPEKLNGQVFPQRIGPLYKAGGRLLPKNPTKAQVQALRVEGEAAWEEYLDELAATEVRAWDRHRQLGGDVPYDTRYLAAKRRLKAKEDSIDRDMKIKLGIEEESKEMGAGELELRIAMEASLIEQMTKMGIEDAATKTATVKKLLEDPKVRQALKKTHRIRKVGEAFEKDEDLEAQVQADIIAKAKAESQALKPTVEGPGVEA